MISPMTNYSIRILTARSIIKTFKKKAQLASYYLQSQPLVFLRDHSFLKNFFFFVTTKGTFFGIGERYKYDVEMQKTPTGVRLEKYFACRSCLTEYIP